MSLYSHHRSNWNLLHCMHDFNALFSAWNSSISFLQKARLIALNAVSKHCHHLRLNNGGRKELKGYGVARREELMDCGLIMIRSIQKEILPEPLFEIMQNFRPLVLTQPKWSHSTSKTVRAAPCLHFKVPIDLDSEMKASGNTCNMYIAFDIRGHVTL